jgi:hypothetical protein
VLCCCGYSKYHFCLVFLIRAVAVIAAGSFTVQAQYGIPCVVCVIYIWSGVASIGIACGNWGSGHLFFLLVFFSMLLILFYILPIAHIRPVHTLLAYPAVTPCWTCRSSFMRVGYRFPRCALKRNNERPIFFSHIPQGRPWHQVCWGTGCTLRRTPSGGSTR